MKPETYLALAERLHARARQAQSRGNTHSAADLRLASMLARRYAALVVADGATAEQDAIGLEPRLDLGAKTCTIAVAAVEDHVLVEDDWLDQSVPTNVLDQLLEFAAGQIAE